MRFILNLGAAALLTSCATVYAEKRAPPIGTLVDVGGERVHIVDLGVGEGPPVVLIHGASVNLLDMKLALGDRLAKSRRVILLDRPGRGYSSRPKQGWRLNVQAKLIHDAVASQGAERPIVVGQSFGGAVALAYALQYQGDMSGLVLLAPVSHEWQGGVAWYNEVAGWPVVGFLFRRLIIPVYAPGAARRGLSRSFGPDDAPETYFGDAGLALLFRPHDFGANASDLRHLKAEIVAQSKRYGEIRLPTAIIAGEEDRTVLPDNHARRLARDIPGATLEMIPDAGHALHHSEQASIIAAIDRIAAQTPQ